MIHDVDDDRAMDNEHVLTSVEWTTDEFELGWRQGWRQRATMTMCTAAAITANMMAATPNVPCDGQDLSWGKAPSAAPVFMSVGSGAGPGRLEGSIPDAARADILKFSRAGLRVLVVAARELDREFLQGWLAAYQQARGASPGARACGPRLALCLSRFVG